MQLVHCNTSRSPVNDGHCHTPTLQPSCTLCHIRHFIWRMSSVAKSGRVDPARLATMLGEQQSPKAAVLRKDVAGWHSGEVPASWRTSEDGFCCTSGAQPAWAGARATSPSQPRYLKITFKSRLLHVIQRMVEHCLLRAI
jgi:hypothetical protein